MAIACISVQSNSHSDMLLSDAQCNSLLQHAQPLLSLQKKNFFLQQMKKSESRLSNDAPGLQCLMLANLQAPSDHC